MKPETNAPLGKDAVALAALFLVSGTLHLVRPRIFEAIVPKQLPAHRALVYASGAAELACAATMFVPRTRRAAGIASAALLVAVFPANVHMAMHPDRFRKVPGGRPALLARLPLQGVFIVWALRAGRS